jgi:NADH-quinone oxidoreductase subunit M
MVSLAVLTFLPLLGALLVALTRKDQAALQRGIALLSTGAVALMGVALFLAFRTDSSEAQMVFDRAWFALPGGVAVRFKLSVDGLSVLMVALTAVLMPFVVLSSFDHVRARVKEFLVWMLVMETGMLGVFLAADLVLFYFFWEVSLIPLYFIVGVWGGEQRLYATIKFFLYTVAGSLVMLVGVIALIYRFRGAPCGADIAGLTDLAANLPLGAQLYFFAAFALAFAIKVPILPFHTWLADAHTQAPTSGSVVLAGVLLKMGTYGLVRFCIAMFPAAAVRCSPLFMALGAAGIVYGAFLAMAQNDLKRLIACSSVSHLGFVVLGLFALTEAGLAGGVLQMVNHGLSTGLLFLLVGMVYERAHTRALDQYGGLAACMPIFALCFTLAMLASVGLPGLNGFVGEYLILLGGFQAAPLWSILGASGLVFGAVYLLMATRKLLYGAIVHEKNRHLADLSPREVFTLAPLLALCLWIGVHPRACLEKTDASIAALVERVEGARERVAAAATASEEGGGR